MASQRWNRFVSIAFLSCSLAACGGAPAMSNTFTQPGTQPSVAQTAVPPVTQTNVPMTDGGLVANETPESISSLRQAWLDTHATNYRYIIERSCFCTEDARGPVTVEVRGEQVTVTTVATGATNNQFFDDVNTITKVYDMLEQHASEGADEISVTHDAATGVPQMIKVDISYQMADEEQFYTISNFEVLP